MCVCVRVWVFAMSSDPLPSADWLFRNCNRLGYDPYRNRKCNQPHPFKAVVFVTVLCFFWFYYPLAPFLVISEKSFEKSCSSKSFLLRRSFPCCPSVVSNTVVAASRQSSVSNCVLRLRLTFPIDTGTRIQMVQPMGTTKWQRSFNTGCNERKKWNLQTTLQKLNKKATNRAETEVTRRRSVVTIRSCVESLSYVLSWFCDRFLPLAILLL